MKTKQIAVLALSASVMMFAQGPRGGGPGGPGAFFAGGGRGGGGPLGGGRVVTGAPYSGTEVLTIQEKFADGNSVNTTTRTGLARDSQGRTRVEQTITPPASAGKAPYTRVTISDPVAGVRYDADSSTMTAVQSRVPRPPPGSGSSSARPAFSSTRTATTLPSTTTRSNGATVTVSSLGQSMINGVLADGTQTVEVIPAGAIGNAQAITVTRTSWISTNLHIPVQIKTSDPRSGTSDMELTNISTGEPAAAMFAVPAGHTIVNGASRGQGRPGPNGSGPRGFGRPGGPPPQSVQ